MDERTKSRAWQALTRRDKRQWKTLKHFGAGSAGKDEFTAREHELEGLLGE